MAEVGLSETLHNNTTKNDTFLSLATLEKITQKLTNSTLMVTVHFQNTSSLIPRMKVEKREMKNKVSQGKNVLKRMNESDSCNWVMLYHLLRSLQGSGLTFCYGCTGAPKSFNHIA